MTKLIEIVEVGPRDGLQNEAALLTVGEKVEFITRLEACGVRRLEAVSFVNPRRVPQMAEAEEVLAGLLPPQDRRRIGLVLNERGWDRAVASGCDEVNLVICASDEFGIRNQGMTVSEQIAGLKRIAGRQAREGGPRVTLTISVAFGCPFSGEVGEDVVVAIAAAAAAVNLTEIALADTIGVAEPWGVLALFEAVGAAAPGVHLRAHFHDTRGAGLANAFAAVQAGVKVLDSSCGGLGGCPFAPTATGNIATEDLIYMLHRAGFETGIDLQAMIEVAHWVGVRLGKPPVSSLSRAGGFPA